MLTIAHFLDRRNSSENKAVVAFRGDNPIALKTYYSNGISRKAR